MFILNSMIMIKKIFNVISIHIFIKNKVHCHIKLINILKEVFILNEFHDLIELTLIFLFLFLIETIATCFIKQNLTIQITEVRESSNHTCSKSHRAFVPSRTCEACYNL